MDGLKKYKENLQKFFDEENYTGARTYIAEELRNCSGNKELTAELFYDLSRLSYFRQEFTEARKQIDKCTRQNISKPEYWEQFGLIEEAQGNSQAALKIQSKTRTVFPKEFQLSHKIDELAQNLDCSEDIEKSLSGLSQEISDQPLVSIIILAYNKIEYTKRCISAVLENTVYRNYEIILLDNASTDSTSTFGETFGKKIKFLRADANLGFVDGNNAASSFADGDYTVFLNNDTEVKKFWLTHLINVFNNYPDAGAVGAKLIYPDGKLQEAGGVIFDDASGLNCGRGGDPRHHLYDYVREVDYCSGAALMVKSELFKDLGGFDTRFAPAYYEDTDLCFTVRELGYKVYYCHAAEVVHHEGVTAGTDINSGFKSFQMKNSVKFVEKWGHKLVEQNKQDAFQWYQLYNRKQGKRILIIDDIPPFPDQAAGALRHYHTLKQMVELGYRVTYVHLMGKQFFDANGMKRFHEFKMAGVEFHWFNYEEWWEYRESPNVRPTLKKLIKSLDLSIRKFDFIYIAFWHIAEYFIDLIRAEIPDTPILIDTMDIHYLREQREAELSGSKQKLKEVQQRKKREIATYAKADCITTVTMKDRAVLQKELPNKPIFILTDVHDVVENVPDYDSRHGLLFVGNFNHTPNQDAVLHFMEKIFPLVKEQIPEIKFYIVGNNPGEKVQALASNSVIVTGWVPEVEPFLEQCRVSVVPLRYGAGNKGKVGEALSYGLPMVSTTIGAEGMNIENGEHARVTDDPQKFAEYVIEIYKNQEIWDKFSVRGKECVKSQYTSRLMRKRLRHIFSFSTRSVLKSEIALNSPEPPIASIIIPVYNAADYTVKCLDSVKKHTNINYELIVVDDHSDEKIEEIVAEDFPEVKVLRNDENLGFPGSVNRGIIEAEGEFIVILNNDTLVTDSWLEAMISHSEKDEKIGIVGPVSNFVSGVQLLSNANYSTPEEMERFAAEHAEKQRGKSSEFPRVAFLCTLIKRAVIDEIGGLDERFAPGNFEDDDFCLRAQLAGFKTIVAQDVFIHHFGSVSFKKDNSDYDELIAEQSKKFSSKWGASPDEIWLKNAEFNKRELKFSIHRNAFARFFERALQQFEENDHSLALAGIQKSIENYDSDNKKEFGAISKPELFNLAGNIALVNNNYEKAIEYFEQAASLLPNSIDPIKSIAGVYYHAEIYDEALKYYKLVNEMDDTDEEVRSKIEDLSRVSEIV